MKSSNLIYAKSLSVSAEMQDIPNVCTKWEAIIRHDDTGHGPWKKVVKYQCTGSLMGNVNEVMITKVG